MIYGTMNEYRIFCTAARLGNLSRTAEALYISQPAVTRAIQELERMMGCPLIIRRQKGISLTEEGEILYREAAAALDRIEAAEQKVIGEHRQRDEVVRVAVNSFASDFLIAKAEEKLRRKRMPVTILRSVLNPEIIYVSLIKRDMDMALVFDQGFQKEMKSLQARINDGRLQQIPLKRQQDHLMAGRKLYEKIQASLQLETIRELPFIYALRSSPDQEYYLSQLRPDHVYTQDYPVRGMANRLELVRNNAGISFFPSDYVREDLRAGAIVKLPDLFPMRFHDAYILLNHDVLPSAAVSALIQELHNIDHPTEAENETAAQ